MVEAAAAEEGIFPCTFHRKEPRFFGGHDPPEFATLMRQHFSSMAESMDIVWLVGAALVTVMLWQVPGGNYALYPFTILATWFHEMAHGLAALLLGGHFTKLLIFQNGSGLAYYTGPLFLGPIGKAVVAAAGPLGPPIAGAALILTSRNTKTASLSLFLLGALPVRIHRHSCNGPGDPGRGDQGL